MPHFQDVQDFTSSPTPGKDPGDRCHGMKASPTGYLCSEYECFLISGCHVLEFLKTLHGNTTF